MEAAVEGEGGFEIGLDAVEELGRIAAGDAEVAAGLGVLGFVEGLDVVEGDFLEAGDGAAVVVAVGGVVIDGFVEDLFTEFLVVVAAQADFDGVDGGVFDAAEIVLAPAGFEEHGADEFVVGVEVFDVGGAAEGGHFLVDLDADGGGHGEHGFDDLAVGEVLGAGVAEHLGGEVGEAGFIGGSAAAPVVKTMRSVTRGDLEGRTMARIWAWAIRAVRRTRRVAASLPRHREKIVTSHLR